MLEKAGRFEKHPYRQEVRNNEEELVDEVCNGDCVCVLSSYGLFRGASGGATQGGGGQKAEGAGFDTPEEAIKAYAEAFKEQDFDKMLATFAVETYCVRYDIDAHIRYVGGIYNPAMLLTYPLKSAEDPYLTDLSVAQRMGNLARSFTYQRLAIRSAIDGGSAGAEALDLLMEGQIVPFEKNPSGVQQAGEMINLMTSPLTDLQIEVGEVIQAEELAHLYLSPKNLENMKRRSGILGADGMKSLAVTLKIGGKDAVLMADAMKFGDKWYLTEPGGTLGALINLSALSGGLLISGNPNVDLEARLSERKENATKARAELKAAEADWTKEHQGALSAFKEETDGLSGQEIDVLVQDAMRESFNIEDPRKNPYMMSFEELLIFFAVQME
ncbi:MAG: hypothetical protein IJR00_11370 [Lachnospiraceae bacterium]|nr:hypothetical protein [Lachnospiraceae bacterium]